jgi:phospholipid/cholesterol/gamma-HCH transport system ATP-binding protein
LTSDEPVVKQFLNGRRIGPIGMSEEKDEATMAEEQAHLEAGHVDGGVEEIEGVPPQILATPGMPERKAVGRRRARVREILHDLPSTAQAAILDEIEGAELHGAASSVTRPPSVTNVLSAMPALNLLGDSRDECQPPARPTDGRRITTAGAVP